MTAVHGPEFFDDPEGHAQRMVAQLKAEAAALDAAPPRYEWNGRYWCVVKSNTGWPNLTGWAEHRESQRIFGPKLEELQAAGLPKNEAWGQAHAYARAEMLDRTTRRKEESDRYYAALDADNARDTGHDDPGDVPPATTTN